jgi:hypothetical protein
MMIAVFALAGTAVAQNADDYRGGWRTDGGEAHTYEFSIRGAVLRSIYCTYCAATERPQPMRPSCSFHLQPSYMNADFAAKYESQGHEIRISPEQSSRVDLILIPWTAD